MFRMFVLSFLFNFFIFQIIQAVPTTCVSCINCQDKYDGTDYNATCASTVPNADSCQKLRIQVPGTTMVAKACATNCQPQSIIAGAIRLDITCCTTSNCNGATTIVLQPILFFILFVSIILFI